MEKAKDVLEELVKQIEKIGDRFEGIFLVVTMPEGALIRLVVPHELGQALNLLGAVTKIHANLIHSIDTSGQESEGQHPAVQDIDGLMKRRDPN